MKNFVHNIYINTKEQREELRLLINSVRVLGNYRNVADMLKKVLTKELNKIKEGE